MIEPGSQAPDFSLPDQDGKTVSLADLAGQISVLVFYPLDFSPVCTDQLNVYQEVLGDLEAQGAKLYGISVHPKGAVAESYGVYIPERGHNQRALVMIGRDGTVLWSYQSATPLEIPGANLIFDALEAHASKA